MISYTKHLGAQNYKDYIQQQLPQFDQINEKQTLQKKDYKFYTSDIIWNNESRLSPKSKKFLNISKTNESQKNLKELQKSKQEELLETKKQQLYQTKQQDRSRSANRRYQLALIQQECHQIIDEKQLKELEEQQVTPVQQKKFILKTNTRQYQPNMPHNFWNNLEEKDKKFCKIVWTDFVIKREEQAINQIKKKIQEEKEVEEMKKISIKNNQIAIRNSFKQRHLENLEKEKQIKIGVFGKNEDIDGKLIRKPQIPESSINDQFPLRYKAKLEIQKQLDEKLKESDLENKASNNKNNGNFKTIQKQLSKNDSCELKEFRGLTIADCNENFVIKNENVANQLANNNRVKKIKDKIQRPSTSNNHVFLRKELVQDQRLKGFYETRSDKSLNLDQHDSEPCDEIEKQTLFDEIDNFEKNLKKQKQSKQQNNKNGFCKVSVKENIMLSSAEGFFKKYQDIINYMSM